jgi:perosamine synthetase
MPDIPIIRPLMDQREVEAASRPILAGWVTQGPEVAGFEREFAAFCRTPHACAVSNCTAALHLALRAVGVGPQDEVVTASHSFIATANSIRYCGAIPVFVDIDPATFNLDPSLVERAISRRTRAILCVHQMGMPCDLPRLCDIARRHSLPLIEDAACAIGSEILWNGAWAKIGAPLGDIACFSFHPRKIITTGDGGMITTANGDWDGKFRLWRQHGMSVPDSIRHQSSQVMFESYPELGYNYRMTDIQAAVGREQLQRLPEIIARRRALAARYRSLLAGIDGVGLPAEPDWARSNWQSFCVSLEGGCEQRQVMQFLLDRGIATRRGIMCSHRESAYGSEPWRCESSGLSRSEFAQQHSIILPLYHQMTDADQQTVAATLEEAVQSARAHQREHAHSALSRG